MLDKRLRLLRLTLTRPHRYQRYRMLTMSITLAVLFGVPLSGLARVDLAGGAHAALFHPASLRVGVVAVLAAIGAFYGATFLVNIVAGRMFCGFGCPVGQLSRLADAVDASIAPPERRRAWWRLIGFALLLAASVAIWWVMPAALLESSPAALSTGGAVVFVAAYAVVHARRFRWGFCQKLCPIGLYYSMVQTASLVSVDYDPLLQCSDCDACRGVCPVHLDPRRLDALTPAPGGLAFGELPGSARCLHCGTCIEMCEHMTRKLGGAAALGFRRPRR